MNDVNIAAKITVSTSPETYHHGALREALIEAGLAALEKDAGDVDISLRALARSVGVSPTAVYRHFPKKSALLAALAAEGLDRLAAAQQRAAEEAGGGAAGFSASGRTYVRFALAHPALFRLMFSHGVPESHAGHKEDGAWLLLVQMTRSLTSDEDGAERMALQAWAIAHGIAMLMLDGRFPADDALIDRLLDTEGLFLR